MLMRFKSSNGEELDSITLAGDVIFAVLRRSIETIHIVIYVK